VKSGEVIALMMEAVSTSETSENFYTDYTAQHPRRKSSSFSPP
jgi:hypothetical protein